MLRVELGRGHCANRITPMVWPVAALLAFVIALLLPSSAAAAQQDQTGRYIIFFKDSVRAPAGLARTQTENRDAKLGFVYRLAFKGYSAE